jgi:hypothetical protein
MGEVEDEWAKQVLVALRAYFEDGRPLLTSTRLVEARLTSDSDGTPVLNAISDRPDNERRIGLRRRLIRYTVPDQPGWDAEALAEDIARYEISEPLGRYSEILVDDGNGVWWWGDGYPELSKNPNAPWYSDLPWARWRKVTDAWTVATLNDQACKSVAVAEGPVTEPPAVLMPPQQVHCVRPNGHIGVHGSTSRSTDPTDRTWKSSPGTRPRGIPVRRRDELA